LLLILMVNAIKRKIVIPKSKKDFTAL